MQVCICPKWTMAHGSQRYCTGDAANALRGDERQREALLCHKDAGNHGIVGGWLAQ